MKKLKQVGIVIVLIISIYLIYAVYFYMLPNKNIAHNRINNINKTLNSNQIKYN